MASFEEKTGIFWLNLLVKQSCNAQSRPERKASPRASSEVQEFKIPGRSTEILEEKI